MIKTFRDFRITKLYFLENNFNVLIFRLNYQLKILNQQVNRNYLSQISIFIKK